MTGTRGRQFIRARQRIPGRMLQKTTVFIAGANFIEFCCNRSQPSCSAGSNFGLVLPAKRFTNASRIQAIAERPCRQQVSTVEKITDRFRRPVCSSVLKLSLRKMTALRIVGSEMLLVGDTPSCAANTKRLAHAFPDLRLVSAVFGIVTDESRRGSHAGRQQPTSRLGFCFGLSRFHRG